MSKKQKCKKVKFNFSARLLLFVLFCHDFMIFSLIIFSYREMIKGLHCETSKQHVRYRSMRDRFSEQGIFRQFSFLCSDFKTAVDSSEDQSSHEGEAGSEEGRPNNCAELHTQSLPHQRLQVRLPPLCPRHQRQPPSHLSLQGRDGEVGDVVKSFHPTKNSSDLPWKSLVLSRRTWKTPSSTSLTLHRSSL